MTDDLKYGNVMRVKRTVRHYTAWGDLRIMVTAPWREWNGKRSFKGVRLDVPRAGEIVVIPMSAYERDPDDE